MVISGEGIAFDREAEKKSLGEFLSGDQKWFLLVQGESGVGKTTIIDTACASQVGRDAYKYFSFKGGNEFGASGLREFLNDLYKLNRGFARKIAPPIQIHGGTIGFSFVVTASTSISKTKTHIDQRYIEQFCKVLFRAGCKVIVLQNLELLNDPDDIAIIDTIVRSKTNPLKFIFEIGSLRSSRYDMYARFDQHPETATIKLDPFDEGVARAFYVSVHQSPAPIDIMSRTRGLPFFIERRQQTEVWGDDRDAIRTTIKELSLEELRFLALIYVCGGSIRVTSAKKIVTSNTLQDTIESLVFQKIISTNDGFAQFRHHFYYMYFDEIRFDEVIKSIRRKVCQVLSEAQEHDFHESMLAALNAIALGEPGFASRIVTETVQRCYRVGAYGSVVRLHEAAINEGTSLPYALLRTWVAEAYVLLGDGASANEVITSVDSKRADRSTSIREQLIQAQSLYEINEFAQSDLVVRESLLDCSGAWACVAHGQLTANAIARGDIETAREHYSAARIEACAAASFVLEYEVRRLSPKIHDKSVAILELRELEQTTLAEKCPITFAKCIHNRGVARLMHFRDLDGLHDVQVSRKILEAQNAHTLTYSLAMEALFKIVSHEYDDAETIMLDALNLAINRYERFSLLSNLGATAAIRSDLDSALVRYRDARDALKEGEHPLLDPDLLMNVDYNISLIHAALGDYEAARTMIGGLAEPSTLSFKEASRERVSWLRGLVSQESKPGPLHVRCGASGDWLAREFRCAIASLSFYDFSIDIAGITVS